MTTEGEDRWLPALRLLRREVDEEDTCILIGSEITWLGIYISRTATLPQLNKSLLIRLKQLTQSLTDRAQQTNQTDLI